VLVLGIESSCDETAAAVVDDEGVVRSDVVKSQVAVHAEFGGVVPEVAARDHARAIGPVVREALSRAGVTLAELGGVAATARPGLTGALLVGLQAAKGLAFGASLPLVGVDHLVGHMLAAALREPGEELAAPSYPFVCLLVSGGHTALYRVDGPSEDLIAELGGTRDDAAGEAFDKVAKLLGLGYPGGPAIDRLAALGDASRGAEWAPSSKTHGAFSASLELSFSGVKSAYARRVAERGAPVGPLLADVCAAFQRDLVRTLVTKTLRAAEQEGVGAVVLAGGVAANRGLREGMAQATTRAGLALFVPKPSRCTDNAAMIAYAGALRLARGERDELSLDVSSRTRLARATRKGRGPR
jgi:N6-L-threonylcarbamoyladenine synthase